MADDKELRLQERLSEIQYHLEWLAELEARAPWAREAAEEGGSIWQEKVELLREAERILVEMSRGSRRGG